MKKIIICSFIVLMGLDCTAFAKSAYNIKVPLPGASKADLKLQADTLISVYTAASIKNPKCKKLSIVDTAIIKQPHNLVKENDKYIGGSWSEQWTVKMCGQNIYVPIVFIINKTGTTYLIDNSKVHF